VTATGAMAVPSRLHTFEQAREPRRARRRRAGQPSGRRAKAVIEAAHAILCERARVGAER
jgi:hypothetical protein